MLTVASVGLTALVLANAWIQRQQFYPSVVYITKSNPSMAVIYLQSLVLVILTGKLMRKLFFGQLRAAEFEHLMERSWYAVTETCLAFTVFKDDFSPKFVALFTLLLFLKSFHWLAEERVDYMERSPVIGILFHLRVLSLALVLTSLDAFFIQHAYSSTLTKGASVQLVFGFEYAILLTIVMNTLVKYVLHSIDLHSENPWENKAVFVLYTELVITLIRVLLYVLFFVIMVRIYTLPLFAVRPMYLTMRAFKKAFNDVVLSRRAIHNMDTLYPDATADELSATDNVCIICREEMTASATKKLPCNHIFHRNCLRSWFQRQQTCPTCRLDVLRAAPTVTAEGAGAQPGAQAVFHQQMAALRAQLEAMQAQRPAGGGPGAAVPGAQPAAAAAAPVVQAQAPILPQNMLQMMMAAQGGVAAQAGAQPQAGATAAATSTSAATSSTATGATAGPTGLRSPFVFPPFPFLPFSAPPPMPPPNFEGLSAAELAAMEGQERQAVEARIRCLRNIQVLLDAAVMEMQQYSSVVARNATTNIPATSIATSVPPTEPGATTSSTSSTASSSESSSISTTRTSIAASPSTSVTSSVTFSSFTATSSVNATTSVVTPSTTSRLSSTETGARPKTSNTTATSGNLTSSASSEKDTKEVTKVEQLTDGVEVIKNPFEALSNNDIVEPNTGRSAEQEEIRRRRLAVFEEQKKRLMNQ